MNHSSSTPTQARSISLLDSEEDRFQAIALRDTSLQTSFFFAVKTTGIYCRPGCPARTPRRDNIVYFDDVLAARRAGFRPCKRCKPDEPLSTLGDRSFTFILQSCQMMDQATAPMTLEQLAENVGLSPFHLQRQFKERMGITPHDYQSQRRGQSVRSSLRDGDEITTAAFRAGFGSVSQFYAESKSQLGMSPSAFRKFGKGTAIQFAHGECTLGSILVAATSIGVCAVSLGDDPKVLLDEFQQQFRLATLVPGDEAFREVLAKVIAIVEQTSPSEPLPLDIRGTAFQCRVWKMLCSLPKGTKTTYSELAGQLGTPQAVRAVATACAANRIAVLVPCHRVVRLDGSLAGYRWGLERKQELLDREQAMPDGRSKT